MSPRMSTRYWIERAEAALRRGSIRMAELYMNRALLDNQNPRKYAGVGVE